jgi:hypothetical protein
MRTLNIYCDGGFGNRFNALTVGLLIAKVGNFKPVIMWPSTNWCRSLFETIFKNEYEVLSDRMSSLKDDCNDYAFVMHNNCLNFPCQVVHPNSFDSIQSIVDYYNQSNKNSFVYNNSLIPEYAHGKDLQSVVKSLIFSDTIVNNVNEFVKHIGKNFIGVHLRNTDYHAKPNFDLIYKNILNDVENNYFICSDDEELELKFTQLDNSFSYKKKKYVEKLTNDGEWRDTIVDDEGNEYSFNIERSDESVIDAMIDLLILSKSTIMHTSDSTFLKTALLIQQSQNS